MGEMKCPLCGGRMLRGHLSAGAYSRIIWTKSDLRWTYMLDAGDLVVEPRRLSSGVLGNTADQCLQCGVILVRRA